MLPVNTGPEAEWVCSTCPGHQTAQGVSEVIRHWGNIIEKTSRRDIRGLSDLLQQTLTVFDKSHYYSLEVKRRIIENMGNPTDNKYEDLSEALLDKKVEFCRDHLEIQKSVSPGLTKYRAYLSSHIAEPLYWHTKKRFLGNKCSKEELHSAMEEVAGHLRMVIQIWGPFRQTSAERMAAEIAKSVLEMVDGMYLHKNLGIEADKGSRKQDYS